MSHFIVLGCDCKKVIEIITHCFPLIFHKIAIFIVYHLPYTLSLNLENISDPSFLPGNYPGAAVYRHLGQTLILHSSGAIYWLEEKSLLIADMHLGKATHFYSHGISVPGGVENKTLNRLQSLLHLFAPEKCYFLGDLFHSKYNHVWDLFCNFLSQYPEVQWTLIPGNHDILEKEKYQASPLIISDTTINAGPYVFIHEQNPQYTQGYQICGHVHPAVILKGKGRQQLRMPCFWFGKKAAILPAFGEFTGMYTVRPDQEDSVFIIANQHVLPAIF